MHELAVTQRLLDLALARAEASRAVRISAVHLQLGELTGLAPECVSQYWFQLSRGTPAEGSEIVFRLVPAVLICPACQGLTELYAGRQSGCSHCGAQELKLHAGYQVILVELDVILAEENENEVVIG